MTSLLIELIDMEGGFTEIGMATHNTGMKPAFILAIAIVCLVLGYSRFIDRPSRKAYQAYVSMNGQGPMAITQAPWDGPDAVVLYRMGRNGVVCYDGFHSKDLHDRLIAKNGQPVTVEYDTFIFAAIRLPRGCLEVTKKPGRWPLFVTNWNEKCSFGPAPEI